MSVMVIGCVFLLIWKFLFHCDTHDMRVRVTLFDITIPVKTDELDRV